MNDGKWGFLLIILIQKNTIFNILIDNKDFADKMGKAGNKRIETKFSIDQMINSYLELYNRILLS